MWLVRTLVTLFVTATCQAQTDSTWTLQQSTLIYHMSHPVHEVEGISHSARGKGICKNGACNFLVAAPVKSFDSGDTNRDLHMLQVTRGAQYPVVAVTVSVPSAVITAATFDCNIDVEFAGKKAHYSHISLHQTIDGMKHHIVGVIPATLTDFGIEAPTFLMMPIKDPIPIRLDLIWTAS